MGCRRYQRLMMERGDEITPEDRQELDAHVADCPSCARDAAGIAAMQHDLGIIRGTLPVAADPAAQVARILETALGGSSAVRGEATVTFLERVLQVIETPTCRYAAAVLLIMVVGAGLWQAMEVAGERREFEAARTDVPVRAGLVAEVEYAVTVPGHYRALEMPVVRGVAVRVVAGSVVLSSEELAVLRGLEAAPHGVLNRLGITGDVEKQARAWKDDPAVRVRPIVSYIHGKGV